MKIGDLVRWSEYDEVQYVPIKRKRMGVVFKIQKSDVWHWWTISVLAQNGERVILYPQHTKIDIINQKLEKK